MHLLGSPARVFLALSILTGAAACGATASDGQSAVPLATATPDEPGQPEESATLDILSVPSSAVKVDGRAAGNTPIHGYKVPAGSHDVTFIDDGGPRTMTVNVEAGEARLVKSDRAPGIIENRK